MLSDPKSFFNTILKIHKLIFTKGALLILVKQISLKKEVYSNQELY